MIELVQPETRAARGEQTHPERLGWGIVDVILAIIMLPFGLWMFLIDRMASGMAWLFNRP